MQLEIAIHFTVFCNPYCCHQELCDHPKFYPLPAFHPMPPSVIIWIILLPLHSTDYQGRMSVIHEVVRYVFNLAQDWCFKGPFLFWKQYLTQMVQKILMKELYTEVWARLRDNKGCWNIQRLAAGETIINPRSEGSRRENNSTVAQRGLEDHRRRLPQKL